MDETKRGTDVPHELVLTGRRELKVSGVKEVLSFDDRSVALDTVCGELTIDGEGLKVSALDTKCGRVSVVGNVTSAIYSDSPSGERKGLFGRLFK